jgi:phage baseplate assembly protein W
MPVLTRALVPIARQERNTFIAAKDSILGQVQVTNELGFKYLEDDIDFGAVGAGEVFQNVKYILLTEYYSVPLDREFGMDFSMVDKPMPIAEAMLSQEIAMKIALYEPRAVFEEMRVDATIIDGKLSPTVAIGVTSIDELQSMYGTIEAAPTPISILASIIHPNGQFTGRITGVQGQPGLAATITVGDTITGLPGTDAKVRNLGDATNAIFEFTIPRGDQGVNAYTETLEDFVLPALGESIDVALDDPSWIAIGQIVVVEGDAGTAYSVKVIAKAGNVVTFLGIE